MTIDEARRADPSAGAAVRLHAESVQLTLNVDALARAGDDLGTRAAVTSRLVPGYAVVCRRAAAWLWGLDVLPPGVAPYDWPVELMVPPGRTPPRRKGRRCHISEYGDDDLVVLDGTRVTSRERTALDCARWLPRLEGVAALDQFLRCGVDHARLAERAALLAGERNAKQLREVIDLGDRGAVLPGESWTRTVIVDAGLPRPRTQVPVPGPGGTSFFIDLGCEQYRVGVEYDGEEHHTSRRDRARDEARRRWLRRKLGWEIIVVTKGDVLVDPNPFLAALMTALIERGWKPNDDELNLICTRLAHLKRRRRAP